MAEEKRAAGFVEGLERDHLLACSARRVRAAVREGRRSRMVTRP
jgi:hypothetical protein